MDLVYLPSSVETTQTRRVLQLSRVESPKIDLV